MQVFRKHDPYGYDLSWENLRVNPFNTEFFISQPSHLITIGHCCIEHRGHVTGINGVIEYGMNIGYRGPYQSQAAIPDGTNELYIPDATPLPITVTGVDGSNIYDRTQHYGQLDFSSYALLTVAGWYRVEVYMHSRRDGVDHSVGLAQILPEPVPTNHLITMVSNA